MPTPDVQFIRVCDTASKLRALTSTIQAHYKACQPLLIVTADQASALYVDELLWRMPEESFTPHAISNGFSRDLIVITTTTGNVNGAKILFNLLPHIHPHYAQFELIYELYDETHPQKLAQSQARLKAYPRSRMG